MKRASFFLFLFLSLGPLIPSEALADDPSDVDIAEAERLFKQGEDRYGRGDYAGAIGAFERSYQLSKEPLLFWNLANAHERLGHLEKALDYYRRWRAVAPAEEHDLIDQRIENLERRIEAAKAAEAPKGAGKGAKASGAGAGAGDAPGVVASPRAKGEEEEGPGLSVPGVLLTGVGLVAVGTGVALDLLAAGRRPDTAMACRASAGREICIDSARSDIETSNMLAIAGDVTWIAGAALAGAGIFLLLTHGGEAEAGARRAAWIAPAASPKGGGLALGGSF